MKKLFAAIILASVLVGCSTTKPIVTPAVVKEGSSIAISAGVQKFPEARPYVVAAVDVICSQAAGTNLSPTSIVAALESSPIAEQVKTANGVLVVNSLIFVYNLAWNSFASEAVANSAARPYLQAVCDGGHEGLQLRLAIVNPVVRDKWPRLRSP